MLNFDVLEVGLVIVPPPHILYHSSRKMFLMLYATYWPNFIVLLYLLLDILGSMCISIVCIPDCDMINFEINLLFLIKPFFCITKESQQKFNYLEGERSS